MLNVPICNAAAERVLSRVTLAKTDIRNRLLLKTLGSVLFVKFELLEDGTLSCAKFVPPENFLTKFCTDTLYREGEAAERKDNRDIN